MKKYHWRREVYIRAEVLVLCASVLAISVSVEDGQADLRHVCSGPGPRVSTCASTVKHNGGVWFIHTSASLYALCTLCIGVRSDVHRC